MAAEPRDEFYAELRAAARVGAERFLVGLSSDVERKRVVAALSAEGAVHEARSTDEALQLLTDESFEIVVLDMDERRAAGLGNPITVARELRPFSDLVLCLQSDPAQVGDAFAREVAAVMPRPWPESDGLLRAHLRWLASCRRSRSRGLLIANATARFGEPFKLADPALASALADASVDTTLEPAVMVMGDADLVYIVGGRPVASAPEVVVVGVGATDRLDVRLQEARSRASGAAIVVVDGAPSPERLRLAVYGGVRAYLDRSRVQDLGRVVACAGSRRQAEVRGRRLVQTLARFGVFDEGDGQTLAPPADVDARLIADATAASSSFVPSGHEVLVVDDEVVVQAVLREALRRGGYRVTTAASAEEAMDLMQKRRFDLVLTDKNLPGASGLDVLRAARALDPAPAVVLITGYSSYDSAVEALDIGVHDYIEKPIRDVDDLRFRIRRALSRRDEQLARLERTPTPRPSLADDGKSARVLVVEVDVARRRLIGEFLGRTYQVATAASGDDAVALLQKQRYDVVLADRNLPGMSGLRVIEQAQRLLPHCASVLYTAYPSYDSVKAAFELGVEAFLLRPSADLKVLGEKVAEALRSRGGILLG